eukprot:1356724-Rhodomonas_salina.1
MTRNGPGSLPGSLAAMRALASERQGGPLSPRTPATTALSGREYGCRTVLSRLTEALSDWRTRGIMMSHYNFLALWMGAGLRLAVMVGTCSDHNWLLAASWHWPRASERTA